MTAHTQLAMQVLRRLRGAELAAACHASYRTLHRRFSAAAGLSPAQYRRRFQRSA